jgi:peptide/nickel transport system permease protein
LVFVFLQLLPGDPSVALLGERATPTQVATLKAQLGLNQPWPVQYLAFLNRLLHFDLGRSILSGIPIIQEIRTRWPATFELASAALLIAMILGIPAGILAAVHRQRCWDHLTMGASLVGVSMPVYWLGLLLKYLCAVHWGWLPPSGRLDFDVGDSITGFYVVDAIVQGNGPMLHSALAHLALPALTLSSIPLAIVARITRSAMLGTLAQDYMRTARAKGVPESRVILIHGLKNALLPVVSIVGLQFGALLGGAILTETIFAWPGIGAWIYDGILARDYPVVQGGVIFVAMAYTLINGLVDLSYAVLDPRIQSP